MSEFDAARLNMVNSQVRTNKVTNPELLAALQRLPDLTAVLNLSNNFAPLFRVEGGKVLRRKDVNNLNDTATIDDWWGWSTYLLLKDYRPSGNTN